MAEAAADAHSVARVNARISAYLVDSVVLLAFILVSFVGAGAVLLFSSDLGRGDPPDSAFNAFIAILLGGPIVLWSAFNLALMGWRGQTTGMYVIGIGIVAEGGRALTFPHLLLRWFSLHPLLFHPFLLPIWAFLSLIVVSITLSEAALIITVGLALLCIASPAANLVALLLDPERRALHDRVAHTVVVHLPQP